MKSADTIKNLFENSKITVGADVDKQILNKAVSALPPRSAQPDTTIWSLIMKTKQIQYIAAAAVVLIAVGLSLVYWQSNKEIQIPPELAAMSVDELIKLHYEQNNTAFPPDIIKTALQRALDKTDPEQVIQIAKDIAAASGAGRGGGSLAAPPVHPVEPLGYTSATFPDIIERSDIFVHANLLNIEFNVDDIINALIEKEQLIFFEGSFLRPRYRVTLTWEVIDTLPEGTFLSGEIIDIPAVINEQQLGELKKHTTYDIGMSLDSNNELHFLDHFLGIYTVDLNNPANLELWQFFADAQDIMKYGNVPEQITIDYWTSKLTGQTFLLALEYMNLLPYDRVPASAIMDAVEIQYDDSFAQAQQDYNEAVESNRSTGRFRKIYGSMLYLFQLADELLLRAGDAECIDRMNALFENDTNLGNQSILGPRNNNSPYYTTRVFEHSKPTSSTEYTALETLYQSGRPEEAVAKALEILAVPPRQENYSALSGDMYRNGELLLILGQSGREDLVDFVEGFTRQEYIDQYLQVFEQQQDTFRMGSSRMDFLHQNAVMALARLGGQSVIPRLREIYNTSNIRIKIVAALALYYNGDMTGEQLVRKFVEGTHLQDPDIVIRWGYDISEGTVFQDVICSYLRNDLTDALLLEKMTHYLDRADANFKSDFYKAYKPEILHIVVEHLNNKDRAIRAHAKFILNNATGQDFGFDPDIYHGRQDDIIQQWRDYLDREYPASEVYF